MKIFCKNLKVLANLISTLGNPLVVGLFFGIYFHFTHDEPESLKNLPLIFALVVVLPLVGYIGYNVFTKKFEDFDVSNRQKRNSVYVLLIFLLSVLCVIIYIKEYPSKALLLAITLLAHIGISYGINQRLKVSMHTSISFLFSWIFYPINPLIAYGLFLFGFLNAWSRVKLSRHTVAEVVFGFILGNAIGIIYLLTFIKLYDKF